jgi:hypothetical protein
MRAEIRRSAPRFQHAAVPLKARSMALRAVESALFSGQSRHIDACKRCLAHEMRPLPQFRSTSTAKSRRYPPVGRGIPGLA